MKAGSSRALIRYGFALPSVIIASTLMLAVLITASQAVSVTRNALVTQQQERTARLAAESGINKARACLRASGNQVTWTNARPLTPSSNCNGATGNSYMQQSSAQRTTFRVGVPTESSGYYLVSAEGRVDRLRASDGSVWDSTEYIGNVAVNFQGILGSMLSSGWNSTCAIANSNTWCWGRNDYGNLGDGTRTQRLEPVMVSRDSGMGSKPDTYVGLGHQFSCSVSGGEVWCWGRTYEGRTGQTTAEGSHVLPQQVTGSLAGGTVTQIAIGRAGGCALTTTGRVHCWGSNQWGQLGNGRDGGGNEATSEDRANPALVNGLTSVTAITSGHETESFCALRSNGQVWCWGRNHVGQLGTGSAAEYINTPQRVTGALGSQQVTEVNMGGSAVLDGNRAAVCALAANNNVYCWGNNPQGQLGDGTTTQRRVPTLINRGQVPASEQITSVGMGIGHACLLTNASRVYCWGQNTAGRLALGHMNNDPSYRVPQLSLTTSNNLGGEITRMDVQSNRSCVIVRNITYCWGVNGSGQLGDGTTEHRAEPTHASFIDRLTPPLYW